MGLDEVVDMLLITMISEGHVLLEGQPGLGKTTLARTFAESIGGSFKRVQMTPDLLPSDILGVNVYNPYDGMWGLRQGPIFANVVLVDELNRASPKVQSAFLQVMQERQVTIENETLDVPSPFMVVAAQAPYGEIGTYPMTSVQIDRFSYRMALDNPDKDTEYRIVGRIDEIEASNVDPVLEPARVLELVKEAKTVKVDDSVLRYIVDVVQGIRHNEHIRNGPSPRASIWLYKGSRVRAMMDDRDYVIPDDVKRLIDSVIYHRVELTPQARADEIQLRTIIEKTLEEVTVPKGIE